MPDAIVIGGGVMGLLSARELRRRGLDVTLVERDQPGKQASWASAGILSASYPQDHGADQDLKRRSEALYPSLVADLVEETDIDPEMTLDGGLIPAFTESHAKELKALAAADPRCQYVEGAAMRSAEPALGPTVIAALLRPGGQIDNRRLCRSLEVANRRAGVTFAPVVVNAAGSWSRQIPGCDPVIPVAPQRGELLALDQSSVGLKRVITKSPDPYLAPRKDGRLIVGATRKYTGYNSSFTAGGIHWLLTEAIGMIPALAECPIVEIWTGFRPNSLDGRPIIGAGAAKGLFFVTGHGPSGIAPAPASAELLADLVTGQSPKLPTAPFDPLRFVGVEMPEPKTWGVRGGIPI
jgi:glycine oxidase